MPPFWLGVKFDEEVPKPTYRVCLRHKPKECPDCGSTEFFLCYERTAREGSVVRFAQWICDKCARIVTRIHFNGDC